MGLPGGVTGVGFGDIAASLSRPGEGWGAAQDLTNTPSTDERYFSIAPRNGGGRIRIVFQASSTNQSGSPILGDRGTTPRILLRRIGYLERALSGSHVTAVETGPRPRAAPGIPHP